MLVPEREHTLYVAESTRRSMGIRQGNVDVAVAPQPPTQSRSLVLAGSTALDPTRLYRIRIRFTPADVVEIGETDDPVERLKTGRSVPRVLRPGDRVVEDQRLAVVYSVDVGNKKNDLIDALLQLKLDLNILKRAEESASSGAISEVFLLNARRNVEGDRSAVARAENTLRLWGIAEKDIQDVRDEAQGILQRGGKRDPDKDKLWPRVELKAPAEGTIVERNVTQHETVVDNTLNIYQIANVDRLLVLANCPEDSLPILEGLVGAERKWTVRTVGADQGSEIEAPIEEVGYLIDPNQHTAVIKGYIDNPEGMLRGGQFVTATVAIPAPRTRFKLTAETLAALRADGVPAAVLAKLTSLVDEDFQTQRQFSRQLGKVLSKEELKRFHDGVLKRASLGDGVVNVVEIPIDALVEDGQQSIVFVETDKDKHWYTMRRVQVVARFDKTAFVRSTEIAAKEHRTTEEKKLGLLPKQPLTTEDRILVSGVVELKAVLQAKESEPKTDADK
jgi:cobalt-zinc-cadmium efflux system membrane fusion protein